MSLPQNIKNSLGKIKISLQRAKKKRSVLLFPRYCQPKILLLLLCLGAFLFNGCSQNGNGNANNQNHRMETMVTITSPDFNKPISSPLTVKGNVTGSYFWEASFPVILQDANGNIIARSNAFADGDWMTTEEVPFTAALEFEKPSTPTGSIIFEKANPSGLPENAHSDSFDVKFE